MGGSIFDALIRSRTELRPRRSLTRFLAGSVLGSLFTLSTPVTRRKRWLADQGGTGSCGAPMETGWGRLEWGPDRRLNWDRDAAPSANAVSH